MNKQDIDLLKQLVGDDPKKADAYNIRKNGQGIERKVNDYINIVPKEDGSGIDIYVKENTLFGIVNIPVILTKSGLTDIVYNDFHIGKGANVIITAGCAIHNDQDKDSTHNGIHRFYLEEDSKVKYIEKHCGEGKGSGKKILNPITEVYQKKNSTMTMETSQLKGVSTTIRKTIAKLEENATLVINEKILTHEKQNAITEFTVDMDGENSSCHVTSRSVATEDSYQEFISKVNGNNKCYAHVECDAILKESGHVKAKPEVYAKHIDANLIHEAAIGKIAGDQLNKLMSLGLTEKKAEETIINGFLK